MDNIKRDLIDLFELDKLAPEKLNETIEKLSNLIFQSVLVRVLPLLSEEDLKEYEKMIDEDTDGQKLFLFLKEKAPNFENIIKEESELLKTELNQKFKEAGV